VDDGSAVDTETVLTAARLVGLTISSDDLEAVKAQLALLRGFAAVVGEPGPEPAPVFQP